MNELTQALERFGTCAALARHLGIDAPRVRMWKSRGVAPHPWPIILKAAKPKKGKK